MGVRLHRENRDWFSKRKIFWEPHPEISQRGGLSSYNKASKQEYSQKNFFLHKPLKHIRVIHISNQAGIEIKGDNKWKIIIENISKINPSIHNIKNYHSWTQQSREGIAFIIVGCVGILMSWPTMDVGTRIKDYACYAYRKLDSWTYMDVGASIQEAVYDMGKQNEKRLEFLKESQKNMYEFLKESQKDMQTSQRNMQAFLKESQKDMQTSQRNMQAFLKESQENMQISQRNMQATLKEIAATLKNIAESKQETGSSQQETKDKLQKKDQ